MTGSSRGFDMWRVPAICLWIIFFAVGYAPEYTYYSLRAWGHVVTQTAAVNSVWVPVCALIAYISIFVFLRCSEYGMPDAEARRRALTAALLATLAFMPFDIGLSAPAIANIPGAQLRLVARVALSGKHAAWCYLLLVTIVYHTSLRHRAFFLLPPILPSGKHAAAITQAAHSTQEAVSPSNDPMKSHNARESEHEIQ